MNTEQTWQTTSTSSGATEKLAEQVGERLRGGEVIELISDLGGGKTTFVRGLARGLQSTDQVRSPSFTLGNVYQGKELTLYHFDFYRLSEPGIMRDELAEVLTDPQAVVAVEWGDIVADVLPTGRLTVKITSTGETERQLTFTNPPNLGYLVEDL